MFRTGVHHAVYRRTKAGVKVFHHCLPLLLSFGNAVEIFLYARRQVIVHDVGETLHQEVVHHDADVGWQQFTLVATNILFLVFARYDNAF